MQKQARHCSRRVAASIATLSTVIKNGSKGAWGPEDTMPAMKKVSDEDGAAMVDFILSIK